jgi:hypothetical protein
MNGIIKRLDIWKLVVFKLFLLAMVAGANTLQTSMAGVEWSQLTTTQKTLLYTGIFISLANTIIAFLDKSISRIGEGKFPIETGTTQFFEKPKSAP